VLELIAFHANGKPVGSRLMVLVVMRSYLLDGHKNRGWIAAHFAIRIASACLCYGRHELSPDCQL